MTKKILNEELILVSTEPTRDANNNLAYHIGLSLFVEEDEYKEVIRKVRNGIIEAKF